MPDRRGDRSDIIVLPDDELLCEIEETEARILALKDHLDLLKRQVLARGTSDIHEKAAAAVEICTPPVEKKPGSGEN